MYLQSYLAHVRGQVGLSIPIPISCGRLGGRGREGEWLSSSLRLASSMVHDKVSGIFKCCTTEPAGWVTTRLPIFLHTKFRGAGLLSMSAKEEAYYEI